MLLVIDLARVIVNLGWISLTIIVFILAYRFLLKRMKRGVIKTTDYVELSTLEGDDQQGEIQFFFKTPIDQQITFRIYGKTSDYEKKILSKPLQKGGHIVKFDTTKVPNGMYFYELTSENQKISKLFEVKN